MPELPDLEYIVAVLRETLAGRPIRKVMGEAIAEVRRRGEPIKEKVRDFLKVRNRKGQACPRCGTTIRVAGLHGVDSFFCPTCQPAARRRFVTWRSLPSRTGVTPASED